MKSSVSNRRILFYSLSLLVFLRYLIHSQSCYDSVALNGNVMIDLGIHQLELYYTYLDLKNESFLVFDLSEVNLIKWSLNED